MDEVFNSYFLLLRNEERKTKWSDFFLRYENVSNSRVIDVSNLFNDVDDDCYDQDHNCDLDQDNYDNSIDKCKEILEKSNIRKILLDVEISRYQIQKSEYQKHLQAFHEETQILSKLVPENWLKEYFASCTVINPEVKNRIDDINTNIVRLFIELTEVNTQQMFNTKYNLYNSEFNRLLKFVSVEDLVLYIRDGFRRYFNESS